MPHNLSRFTLKLSILLFLILAVLEYLYKGFVSYFFDIRVIFGIILVSLIIQFVGVAKKTH